MSTPGVRVRLLLRASLTEEERAKMTQRLENATDAILQIMLLGDESGAVPAEIMGLVLDGAARRQLLPVVGSMAEPCPLGFVVVVIDLQDGKRFLREMDLPPLPPDGPGVPVAAVFDGGALTCRLTATPRAKA